DDWSCALLLLTNIIHAGDWLGVIASSTLGLHLLDAEFRVCLCYWLGVLAKAVCDSVVLQSQM
uniref:Uncharacterized protein n=1 Tax=Amphimedon queenslandica TaxID=400682 RepID=A0A1X7TNI1_AMPQE